MIYDTVVTKNDQTGNLTKIIYLGNKSVSYTYDAMNRLETVTIDWLNQTATYYYDDAGRLDRLENFNSTLADYRYDDADRLVSLVNRKSDGTVICSYAFPVLDGNGNRLEEIREEPISSSNIPTEAVSFTYNPERNRLQSAGTESFHYDFEGQLSNKSGTAYTFDYAHRLKTIGIGTLFLYDGAGNRLKALRDGVITNYVYDAAGNLLAEADVSYNIRRYYIHCAGLLAMVNQHDGVSTYHYNAVGSTIATTLSDQSISHKYAYTPLLGSSPTRCSAAKENDKHDGYFKKKEWSSQHRQRAFL